MSAWSADRTLGGRARAPRLAIAGSVAPGGSSHDQVLPPPLLERSAPRLIGMSSPDGPHPVQRRVSFRIVERARCIAFGARHDRTLVAAPSRDEHLRLVPRLRRQPGGRAPVRSMPLPCIASTTSGWTAVPGRFPRKSPAPVRDPRCIEPGRRHLGSAGICDAREQHVCFIEPMLPIGY